MSIQNRPNENIIFTGNYFQDAIENMVEILKREQKEDAETKLIFIKRNTPIYNDDILIIPQTPAIAVTFTDFDEEVRTIGRQNVTFMLKIYLSIFYYHSELKTDIRKREITTAIWELGRLIRRNSDLNGLSSVGAYIERGEVLHRVRMNKIYSGGKIAVTVPILVQDRRAVS